MYNFNSHNTIIIFAGLTRGNFVRCCLTLSPNTADAAFKMSDINTRLRLYKENTSVPVSGSYPWGPGHFDEFFNFDPRRFVIADHAPRYVHCGHYGQIPHIDVNNKPHEFTPLINKKFVVITINKSECDEIQERSNKQKLQETDFFLDNDNINEFIGDTNWYNLPYGDILNKEKFLNHCHNIDSDCYIDKISDYYDIYSVNNMKQ